MIGRAISRKYENYYTPVKVVKLAVLRCFFPFAEAVLFRRPLTVSYSFSIIDKSTGSKKSDEAREENKSSGEKNVVKKKRNRSHFTQVQLKYLEDVFSRQQYLTRDERALLANALDMTELQIRNWFQNRRYQLRHRGVNRPRQVPVKVLVSSSTAHVSKD